MSADHKTLAGMLDVMGITGEIAVVARDSPMIRVYPW